MHHSNAAQRAHLGRLLRALAQNGITASVGCVSDSHYNAMAESRIELHKTELIRPPGPWSTVDRVELNNLGCFVRLNYRRLHGEMRLVPAGGVRDEILRFPSRGGNRRMRFPPTWGKNIVPFGHRVHLATCAYCTLP